MHRRQSNPIQESYQLEIQNIKKIIKGIESKSLSSTIDNRLVKIGPLEFLYAYTTISQNQKTYSPYRKLLVDMLSSLETAFPGSAYLAAKMITDGSDSYRFVNTDRLSSSDIFGQISSMISSVEASILKSVVSSGGFYRSVHFEDSKSPTDCVIKCKDSDGIQLSLDQAFNGQKKTFIEKGKIIFLDAVFESMSELDNLMSMSHRENIPIVIVARGFLPDVSSTLKYSFDQKKSKVFPVVISYSDDDPYEMDDICHFFGKKVFPGRISTCSDEEIKKLSAECSDIMIEGSSVTLSGIDINASFDNEKDDTCNRRMERLNQNSMEVKTPIGFTLLNKSRLKKCIYLYRMIARENSAVIENFDHPTTLNAYKRILSSVDGFKRNLNKIRVCIKV